MKGPSTFLFTDCILLGGSDVWMFLSHDSRYLKGYIKAETNKTKEKKRKPLLIK